MVLEKAGGELYNCRILFRILLYFISARKVQGLSDNFKLELLHFFAKNVVLLSLILKGLVVHKCFP